MKKQTFGKVLVITFLASNVAIASTNYSYQATHVQPVQNVQYNQQPLQYIKNNPGCKQTDLSTYLKVTPASIAVSTKRLEKAGFIEKQVDQENLRQNCLYLTSKGLDACDNMKRFFNELDNNALKDISVEDYELLEKLLDKMIYNYVGTSVDEIDLNSLLEQKCKEEEEHEKVN